MSRKNKESNASGPDGYSDDRKQKAVLDALRERDEDLICSEIGISEHTLDSWKQEFLEGGRDALSGQQRSSREHGLIAIILMGAALVLLLVYFILQSRLDAAYVDLLPLGAAVGIMLAAFVQEWHVTRTVERTLEAYKDQANAHHKEVHELISEELNPNIFILPNREQVLRQTRTMILDATKPPDEERRFILCLGSPNLLELSHSSEDDNSPEEAYRRAWGEARSKGVVVQRYINLMSTDEFLSRQSKTQQRYLDWLKLEAARVKSSESKYSLMHSTRAPRWGDGRTSIITHESVLEILGQGIQGHMIRGERVAETLYTGIVDFLNGKTGDVATEVKLYDDESLNKYREKLAKSRKGGWGRRRSE